MEGAGGGGLEGREVVGTQGGAEAGPTGTGKWPLNLNQGSKPKTTSKTSKENMRPKIKQLV